jgi:hypothetical protein
MIPEINYLSRINYEICVTVGNRTIIANMQKPPPQYPASTKAEWVQAVAIYI